MFNVADSCIVIGGLLLALLLGRGERPGGDGGGRDPGAPEERGAGTPPRPAPRA